jgi:hypothetical protein
MIAFIKKHSVAIGLASLATIVYFSNLGRSIQILIGLLFLAFGCFLDFSFYSVGTILRFIFGLSGAYLILGQTKNGIGYIIGMICGLIGYSWAIQSGSLSVFDMFYVEGFVKYAMRIACAFFFILGLKDVKEN